MKILSKLLVISLLSGCATMNRVTIVTSTASIACDWHQTRSSAVKDWKGFEEENPILGKTPTPHEVDAYMAAAAGANIALWAALPEKYRWIVPTIVTAVQIKTILGNNKTVGYCI